MIAGLWQGWVSRASLQAIRQGLDVSWHLWHSAQMLLPSGAETHRDEPPHPPRADTQLTAKGSKPQYADGICLLELAKYYMQEAMTININKAYFETDQMEALPSFGSSSGNVHPSPSQN